MRLAVRSHKHFQVELFNS